MNNFFLLITILTNIGFVSNSQQAENYKLIVFEGSDWCSSCRRFEKEILSDSAVINFLKANEFELIKVDFPQRKKLSNEDQHKNKTLAEKYDFKGVFPTIILATNSNSVELKVSTTNPQKFIDLLYSEMQTLKW